MPSSHDDVDIDVPGRVPHASSGRLLGIGRASTRPSRAPRRVDPVEPAPTITAITNT